MSFKHSTVSLILLALFAVATPSAIFAQESGASSVQFPIAALDGCSSPDECRAYCDQPEHGEACASWASSQGIEVKRRPADVPPEGGPGGCTSPDECRSYCKNEANIDECTAFAVEKGHITKEQAERIRAGGPGGCRDVQSCHVYCSQEDHHEECLDFAVKHGIMTADEAREIKQLVKQGPGEIGRPRIPSGRDMDAGPRINKERAEAALKESGGPGGCTDHASCGEFCSLAANAETCFAFAEEHGLFEGSADDVAAFKNTLNAEGPGGCRGAACRDYCEVEGRERECLEFAEKQGLIKPEEAAQMKKFIEVAAKGGPGGCRGRACETYCSDETHREECFSFAKTSGLLPPEELERLERMQAAAKSVEEKGGPGGCRNEKECRTFCSDTTHFEECAAFSVQAGFLKAEDAEQGLRRFVELEKFGPGEGGFGDPRGFEQFEQSGMMRSQDGESGGMPFGKPGMPPADFQSVPPEYGERAKFDEQRTPGPRPTERLPLPSTQGEFPAGGDMQKFDQYQEYQRYQNFEGGPNGGMPRMPPSGMPSPEEMQHYMEKHEGQAPSFQPDMPYAPQPSSTYYPSPSGDFAPDGGTMPPPTGIMPAVLLFLSGGVR